MPQPSPAVNPKIVAAIPCLNTEPWIGDVVSRAGKYVSRVIVIDDGSRDGTVEAATAAGALVVSHGVNRGYGAAIRSCFEAAKEHAADILVIIDGDGQHDPDEIPRLLSPLLRREADIVIGSRFLDGRVRMPPYRRFGINVITWLWNFGSKVKVSDTQSGFRAYGRAAFQGLSLSGNGMGVSIEIIEQARRTGAVIREVPISCFYPPSRLNLGAARHGLRVALDVPRIRLKGRLSRRRARRAKAVPDTG